MPTLGLNILMIIATWNLNNRVGKVRFRPEAVHAAIAARADLFVFTEFYPRQYEGQFRSELERAGWSFQMMSCEPTEVANRILIVSRFPILLQHLALPDFDQQFPSNLLGVTLPTEGLSILGVRVPAYTGDTTPLLFQAWEWLEATAANLKRNPTVILGDLNVSTTSGRARAGDHFRRIIANGWTRAMPLDGSTFFSNKGYKSEIDHILVSNYCTINNPIVIKEVACFSVAGVPNAISDHAILMCNIEVKH